jgi:septum formation protein
VVLGKPADTADAIRMLRVLAGRDHRVLTGICLRRGERTVADFAETRVWFETLTESEIAEYVHSGEPMDKAGAYAIQGYASRFITKIDGCYQNVVGLPVSLVYRYLKTL